MNRYHKMLIGIGIAFVILVGVIFVLNFRSQPAAIGVTDGKLAACPQSPNCVSTQTDQPEKKMEPLKFAGSAEQAMGEIKTILKSMPRTRLVTQSENYLHFEVRSLLMRYVDDVEFLVDPEKKQIDFRSASRIGHSDLGVNRDRMETIAHKFQESF